MERLAQKYAESGFLRRGNVGGAAGVVGGDGVGGGGGGGGKQCEIVIAADNHLANVTSWLNAARATGAVVRWWLCTTGISTGSDTDEPTTPTTNTTMTTCSINTNLRNLLTPQTRIVAISHSSNLIGTVYDIKSIRRTVREVCGTAAQIVVDGVALVPHSYADVKESGVDWYVLSCHKLFGPHIGGLYGMREALRRMMMMTTTMTDAGEDGGDDDGRRRRRGEGWKNDDELYRAWEVGTVNYEACAGIDGLGVYLSNIASLRSDDDSSSRGNLSSYSSSVSISFGEVTVWGSIRAKFPYDTIIIILTATIIIIVVERSKPYTKGVPKHTSRGRSVLYILKLDPNRL